MRGRTHYLLRTARNPLALLAAAGWALGRPGRFLSAIGLAWSIRPAGLRALVYQLIYLVEAMLLARHARAEGCGHIHSHFANSSTTVAMLAARMAGLPYSFTLHGPSDLFEARYWRLDRKIAGADFVACISHFARSQAMLNADIADWPKLRIVHCGVVPATYAGDRPPPTGDRIECIFVGRLAAVKGLPVLFEALAAAREDQPGLHLSIVGDGPDRAMLTRLAAPLGGAVTFAGALSQHQVAEALQEADMMVLPSFAEGVPVVLMEALASGLPAIATRVAGVPELVDHEVSGLIVAPGDVAGLRDAILRLAVDPAGRARMGQAGRERVVADYDIAREGAWLAHLFRGEAGTALRPGKAAS